MRGGSFERDFLKMRKVKVGTLGTIEHCFKIKDLAWNITWNNIRTKRHLVVKFVLDKQSLFCYAGYQHKEFPSGYGVVTNDRS
jgi:hypothetical protein